jgi:hypothetical protein
MEMSDHGKQFRKLMISFRQIVKPKPTKIILSIIGFVFLLMLYAQLRFIHIRHRLEPLAEELLRTQSSSEVVSVGGSAASRLSEVAAKQNVSWKVYRGDCEYGDGTADAYIIYASNNQKLLGLRMACKQGKIHILGYWIP